ncbi:MAG: PEP-CTERM sorting domain-containing protein [Planctomycetes bacterium]|nr:PEP-CTERM sorting domain-containing protein [Planctomycetota bacterium]
MEKSNYRRRWSLASLAGGVVLACLLAVPGALADDANWTGNIAGTGPGFKVDLSHQDADPFKGWLNVTATNTGSEDWGDFHFGIYDPIGGQDISNVHFLDSSMGGFDPTSSQAPLTWTIDNVTVGATIDLFYFSDPVAPGETATFNVWTDNPDHLSFFGVSFYPTPVPEPTSLALMAALGLFIRRR